MAVQNITEEILKVLYVDLELTTKKIGKILGCDRTTILRYLKKYDIIIRKHVVESKQITVPELDKELAYFYGMLQGNGYVHVPSKSSPSGIVGISCGENLLLVDKVLEQLKRFNVGGRLLERGEGHTKYTVIASSLHLSEYLVHYKKPYTDPILPEEIRKGSKIIKESYLAGLFDADGSNREKVWGINKPLTLVSSVHAEFQQEIQELCADLGLFTMFRRRRAPRNNGKHKALYYLFLPTASIESFVKKIAKYSIKFDADKLIPTLIKEKDNPHSIYAVPGIGFTVEVANAEQFE